MISRVAKIDIAVEYLRDSLAHFKSGHYFSALNLAGASEEILGNAIRQLSNQASAPRLQVTSALNDEIKGRMHLDRLLGAERRNEKQIREQILAAKNSAKHYDAGDDGSIDFDPQCEAANLIFRAITNYRIIFPTAQDDFEIEEQDIANHQMNEMWKRTLSPSALRGLISSID